MSAERKPQVFRSWEQVILGVVVVGVVSARGIQVGLEGLHSAGAIAAVWAVWIVLWLPIVRALLAVVVAYPDGRLKVRNNFTTRRLTARDIRGFSLRRWGVVPLMGHADLVDGTSLHLTAVPAPNPMLRPRSHKAKDQIAELNLWLESMKRSAQEQGRHRMDRPPSPDAERVLRPVTARLRRLYLDLVALSALPAHLQQSARVEPNGEVSWRDEEAAAAVEALTAAGHTVLGLDVRFYLEDGTFHETAWSDAGPDPIDPLAARAHALERLSRIDDLEGPKEAVERRVLVTWR